MEEGEIDEEHLGDLLPDIAHTDTHLPSPSKDDETLSLKRWLQSELSYVPDLNWETLRCCGKKKQFQWDSIYCFGLNSATIVSSLEYMKDFSYPWVIRPIDETSCVLVYQKEEEAAFALHHCSVVIPGNDPWRLKFFSPGENNVSVVNEIVLLRFSIEGEGRMTAILKEAKEKVPVLFPRKEEADFKHRPRIISKKISKHNRLSSKIFFDYPKNQATQSILPSSFLSQKLNSSSRFALMYSQDSGIAEIKLKGGMRNKNGCLRAWNDTLD